MVAGRFKKLLVIAAVVLATVFLTAALVLPRLIDLNTYHDQAVNEAEALLGRPVRLGEMRLSLLPPVGVRVREVVIGAATPGGADLIRVEEASVRLKILPLLLRREIAVGSIAFNRPVLTLHRLPDGRWDLPGLDGGPGAAEAEPVQAGGTEPGLAGVAVDRFRIRDGTVTFIDDLAGGTGTPGEGPRATLEGLDLSASFALRPGTVIASARGSVDRLSAGFPGGLAIRDGSVSFRGRFEIVGEKTTAELASFRFAYGGGAIAGSGSFESDADTLRASLEIEPSKVRPADLAAVADHFSLPIPTGLLGAEEIELGMEGRVELTRDPTGEWALSELDLGELTLDGPHLILARNARGELLLGGTPATAVGGRDGGSEAAAPAGSAQESAGGGTAGGLPIRVGRLRIGGARIEYRDEALAPSAPLEVDLNPVSVEISDLSPSTPARLRIVAGLPGRKDVLELDGTITPREGAGPTGWSVDASLAVRRFPVDLVSGLLAHAAGVRAEGGEVDLEIAVRGVPEENLTLRGKVGIHGTRAAPIPQKSPGEGGGAPAPTSARPVPVECDVGFDLEIIRAGERVGIRELSFSFPESRLTATGGFEKRADGIWVDLTVPESKITAQDIRVLTPALNLDFPPGLTASEPITLTGKISGPLARPAELRVGGSIDLRQVRFESPALGTPVEDVRARVEFTHDSVTIRDMGARLGGTRVTGSLSLERFAAPRVRFDLSSEKADLGEILALLKPMETGAPAGSKPSASRSAAPASVPPNPLIEKTTGRGTIRLKEGVLGSFRFTDFEGTVAMNGLRLEFDPLAFALYDGTYRGSATADLRGAKPQYTYRMRLEGVKSDPLITDNLGMADLFGGVVTADLQLAGSGSDYDTIVNALTGGGSIRVVDGWIGRLDVMGGIARAADKLGETTLRDLGRTLAGERTPFRELKGSVSVKSGRVSTRNLELFSESMDLRGKGSFSLAGDLDFDLKVLFSETLSRAMEEEGSRGRYLGREGNRYIVPLRISGSLLEPAFTLDLEQVARSTAKRKLEDSLLKRVGVSREGLRQLIGQAKEPSSGAKAPADTGSGAEVPADTGAGLAASPGSSTPSAAAPPPSAGAEAASPAQGLEIRVTRARFSGNFLRPDLRIQGTFSGVGIDHADVVVRGRKDKVLYDRKRAFREIDAYFAGHDRQSEARIEFSLKVDRVTLRSGVRVTIVLHATDGRRVEKMVKVDR